MKNILQARLLPIFLLLFLFWYTTESFAQLSVSVSADPAQVCANQPIQLSSVVSGGSGSYTYSWVGTPGTFTSSQANPIDAPNQTTNYTLTVSDGFSIAVAQVNVDVIPYPVGNAGADGSVCESTYSIALEGVAYNYSSVTWQCVNGNGGFFINNNSLTPSYVMSDDEKDGGYLQFKLFTYAQPPCNIAIYDVDEVVYTIVPEPTVDAGSDDEVCEGQDYLLSGASVQDYSSIQWSSSGTGFFSNEQAVNPIYTPSDNDYNLPFVTLTLTAGTLDGCTGNEADEMILTFEDAPEVEAGDDFEICEDDDIQLNATGSDYASVLWTSSGTGNFQNSTSLNAIYLPSDQDILNGTVTLTITATGNGPCEEDVVDMVTIEINDLPVANAGADDVVCETGSIDLEGSATDYNFIEWSTTGDGEFTLTDEFETNYTPGAADIAQGEVDLVLRATATSPCSATDYDTVTIVVHPNATVDAGEDQNGVCTNMSVELEATASDYSEVLWTTPGDGYFDDPTALVTSYHPGSEDLTNNSMILTITALSETPCLAELTDEIEINFIAGPISDAGVDTTLCETITEYQLSGYAGNSDGATWSTSGNGTFNDVGAPNTTYIIGSEDVENGAVTLTFNVYSDNCGSDTDDMVITVQNSPEVEITSTDTTLCNENTINLEAEAINYGSVNWSTNGDGTFDESDILTPVYTLGADDIESGVVRLIVSAFAQLPCDSPDYDTVYIYHYMPPIVDAGLDTNVCSADEANNEGFLLEAYVGNAVEQEWSVVTGSGSFEDASMVDARYIFSEEDIIDGFVTLKLTAFGQGVCEDVEDEVNINVTGAPTADIGEDLSVCAGNTVELTAVVSSNGGQGWGTMGDGTFSDDGELTTIYTPGPNDISDGLVEIRFASYALTPCPEPMYDTLFLTIVPQPVVDAGAPLNICRGEVIETNPSIENYGEVEWTTPGDGYFDDPNAPITIYNPGENDLEEGTVWLTLNVEAMDPCTEGISDELEIYFKKAAVFDLGDNIEANYDDQLEFEPEMSGGSGVYTYEWSPEEYFINPYDRITKTIKLEEGEVEQTFYIYLSVTDNETGCVSTDSVMIGLELGDVRADILASPQFVCEGGSSVLDANPSGGSSTTYEFDWTSIPSGFVANTQEITVSPEEDTKYIVLVRDGFTFDYDTIDMAIKPSPSALTIQGNINVTSGGETSYTVTDNDNWIYDWGVINGAVSSGQYSSNAVITWGNPGSGSIWVTPTNQYGCEGPKSEIDVSIANSTIDIPELDELESLSVYPNPFENNFNLDIVLNTEAAVSVDLFNNVGQKIATIDKGIIDAGLHRINFNERDLGEFSGLLILRLTINDKQSISRILKY